MKNPNVASLFFEAAQQRPFHTAIIHGNGLISYSQLRTDVEKTAAYFSQKGITAGDRILVCIPLGIDLYRILLAIISLGATAVVIDDWSGFKRLEECCKLAECRGWIALPKIRLCSLFIPSLRKIPITLNHKTQCQSPKSIPLIVESNLTALITFTTGSTGIPKAVPRSHLQLRTQCEVLVAELRPSMSDICLSTLPIVILMNLGIGCTSVISDFSSRKSDLLNPAEIAKSIESNQINRIIASPYYIRKLSEHISHNKLSLSSVRHIITGGAPVYKKEAELFKLAFKEATTSVVYGSTEAEPISIITAENLILQTDGSSGIPAGRPSKFNSVRIIKYLASPVSCTSDFELLAITLPTRSIGEIIVAGAHVLREYLNNPAAMSENKITYNDICWHRTGDSGYFDEYGRLFLTGRCSALIQHSGNLLSPFVYEQILIDIEGVETGTMVKIGDQIIIAIQIRSNADIKKIEKIILDRIPIANRIVRMSVIPRDPRHFSKIDYNKLVSQIQNKY